MSLKCHTLLPSARQSFTCCLCVITDCMSHLLFVTLAHFHTHRIVSEFPDKFAKNQTFLPLLSVPNNNKLISCVVIIF